MDIGTKIRVARKNKGLSQIELAEKSDIAVNSLRLYEANKRQPRPDTLQRIAIALNVPVADFIGSIDVGLLSLEIAEEMGVNSSVVYGVIDGLDLTYPITSQDRTKIKAEVKRQFLKKQMKDTFQGNKEKAPKLNLADIINHTTDDQVKRDLMSQVDRYFDELNEAGQKEAAKRVAELTEIPRYQKDKK